MSTETAALPLIAFSVEERQNYSPVGLRALARMEAQFHLSDVEVGRLLGGVSRSDAKEWKRAALAREPVILTNEALNRLRNALLVFQQLGKKFPKTLDKAEEWLRKPHPLPSFGGRSPLAMMMDVEMRYMLAVVRYAQAQPLVTDAKLAINKPDRRRPRP